MKLKSLLLGSAAALVAFSGARAADAVIAEPEPVEYVRICDAYGAGFFFIPGTETCLKIGGFVRYEINMRNGFRDGSVNNAKVSGWEKDTTASIQFDVRSDTEMGTLRAFIDLRATASGEGNSTNTLNTAAGINALTLGGAAIEQAFIELGGFRIGSSLDYFDAYGIGGENDALGGKLVNLIGYTYAADGFNAAIALVDDNDNNSGVAADYTPNLQATAGFTAGPANVQFVAAYDNDTEEYAVKGVAIAEVTEGGKLGLAVVYSSGATYTWDLSEWSVAASYTQKATDTLSVSLGGQYWSDVNGRLNGGVTGVYNGGDGYSIGANVDWTPVKNFLVRGQIQYVNFDNAVVGLRDVSVTNARIRIQRSF